MKKRADSPLNSQRKNAWTSKHIINEKVDLISNEKASLKVEMPFLLLNWWGLFF